MTYMLNRGINNMLWAKRNINSDGEQEEVKFQRGEFRLTLKIEEWFRKWHDQGDEEIEVLSWLGK